MEVDRTCRTQLRKGCAVHPPHKSEREKVAMDVESGRGWLQASSTERTL